MSAQAGWYPDPGGGQDLYRYWDGRAWSAATSPNPSAPPPAQGLVGSPAPSSAQPLGTTPGTAAGHSGGQAYGTGSAYGTGGSAYGAGSAYGTGATGSAYTQYQQSAGSRRSPVGWWLAGAALLVVLVVIAVVAVRAATGGGGGLTPLPGGPGSQNACPTPEENPSVTPDPADGRVHGGPVSYPRLGAPWSAPEGDDRVPFGADTKVQQVVVEPNYQPRQQWVASILVAELQAGDGFFSPEQGSQVVVKCILGAFYGNAAVTSDVKVNEAATIDGHEAWIVESQLSFDIEGLKTKGELLLVAIVSAGATSGLYYASIPDTRPELVEPAREALQQLQVDS